MDTRPFLALLAAGFVLLALGRAFGGDRGSREAGLSPLGLGLKGAGLALMSYALYRMVKGHA